MQAFRYLAGRAVRFPLNALSARGQGMERAKKSGFLRGKAAYKGSSLPEPQENGAGLGLRGKPPERRLTRAAASI